MRDEANIVEQYTEADVAARVELLIKYYPSFPRLIEGYEQSLSYIIKEEKDYLRKSRRGDLGVRVQTSGLSDITAQTAIDNIMIREAIESGSLESLEEDLDDEIMAQYEEEIRMLQCMKEDFEILKASFFYLDPEAAETYKRYLACGRKTEALAYELDIKPEALKMQMCRTKKIVFEQTENILIRKYRVR